LAALISPSDDEQTLITSTVPCWARVTQAQHRELSGQTGAFSRSYVPISVAEAVSTLGFGWILTQIEVATVRAGQALLAEAETQQERTVHLSRVERMLGVDSESSTTPADFSTPIRRLLVLTLLAPAGQVRLAPAIVLWGIMVILVCFLFGIPQAVVGGLFRGASLLFWQRISSM
jgi:hypothetical protein